MLLMVTDISTTCAVVIFWDKGKDYTIPVNHTPLTFLQLEHLYDS